MSARKPQRNNQQDIRVVPFGDVSFDYMKSVVADISAAHGGQPHRFWHDGVLYEMTMKVAHQHTEEDAPIPLMYRHPDD